MHHLALFAAGKTTTTTTTTTTTMMTASDNGLDHELPGQQFRQVFDSVLFAATDGTSFIQLPVQSS